MNCGGLSHAVGFSLSVVLAVAPTSAPLGLAGAFAGELQAKKPPCAISFVQKKKEKRTIKDNSASRIKLIRPITKINRPNFFVVIVRPFGIRLGNSKASIQKWEIFGSRFF